MDLLIPGLKIRGSSPVFRAELQLKQVILIVTMRLTSAYYGRLTRWPASVCSLSSLVSTSGARHQRADYRRTDQYWRPNAGV